MCSMIFLLGLIILIVCIECYLANKFNNRYLNEYELLDDIESELGKTKIVKKPSGFDLEFKSGNLTKKDINSKFQKIKEANKKFDLELKQIDSGLYKILITIKN